MSASLDKHQSGMQYLNMRKATLAWPLMCLLVAGSLLPAHALRVGILQQQSDTVSKGRHNLDELAAAMTEWGHRVDVLTVDQQTPFWEAGVTLEQDLHPTHEALFVQGELSTQVADAAALWGIPVVRFMPDSRGATAEPPFQPHRERPAVFVFAAQSDASRFSYVEEAPRVVLPPSDVSDLDADGYADLDLALQAAVAARPQPSLAVMAGQVGCEQGKGAPGDGKDGDGSVQAGTCTAGKAAGVLAEEGQAPLLGLVMIVKNENATLERTLRSIKGDIDYWTIVDTGSTDGTQSTINAVMAGVPGQQLAHEFVDFSTTRNYALQAHGQRTQWAFMLDADFQVAGAWRLRLAVHRLSRECAARSVVQCPKGIKVWFHLSDTGFFSNRVFPTSGIGTKAGWHYTYPVHEVPGHDGLAYLNMGVIDDVMEHRGIVVQGLPINHTKSPDRWKNMDLPLLLKEHERNPADTRTVFYLGQTYDLIGDVDNALATYQQRIVMGGWQQEVFESHLRRGKIKHRRLLGDVGLDPVNDTSLDPAPDMVAALALYPRRAEPLLHLSWHAEWLHDHWCHRDADPEVCQMLQRVAAYEYARQAAEMPFPGGDTLFADTAVYDYQAREQLAITAWYVAKEFEDAFAVGVAAARKLSERFPGDERRRANMDWYESLKGALR